MHKYSYFIIILLVLLIGCSNPTVQPTVTVKETFQNITPTSPPDINTVLPILAPQAKYMVPSLGATDIPMDITFVWPRVTDAAGYEFMIAEDRGTTDKFAAIDYSATTKSSYLGLDRKLKYNTRYWWRVRALNTSTKSDWATCFFTTVQLVSTPSPTTSTTTPSTTTQTTTTKTTTLPTTRTPTPSTTTKTTILSTTRTPTQPTTTSYPSITTLTTSAIALNVSATKMYIDYQLNALAADAKYKGKIINVTGIVVKISTDLFGNPYVYLAAGQGWQYGYDVADCSFNISQKSSLSQLTIGKNVTIQGNCQGFPLLNIEFENCRLISQTANVIPPTTTATTTTTTTSSQIQPFTVKVTKYIGPIQGSNLMVYISTPGSLVQSIWVQTMILRSDVEVKTYNIQESFPANTQKGSSHFLSITYQNPSVEVILQGSNNVVLFDQKIPITQ
jgi:hypothetical protein